MNEVFVVLQGHYSDRHIEGIFDSEAAAIRFTRAHKIPDWYSQYDIERWPINPPFYKDQWVQIEYNYSENKIDHIETEYCSGYEYDAGNFIFPLSINSDALERYIYDNNDTLLLKVAQDRYAEYKAKKEGII